MRKFLLPSGALIVFFALISCAGAPIEDENTALPSEATAASVAAEEISVPIWKPAELTSSYVDGTVDKTVVYSYGNDGRLLQTIDSDGRGNTLLEQAFEYKNGYLVKETASDSTGPISITLYDLTKDNQVETQIKQDPLGNVLSVVRYEYDGELIKSAVASDGSGVPLLITEYQYLDNEIATVLYKTSSGIEEARFERIMENGMLVREHTVLPDGSVETAREYLYEDGINTEVIFFTGASKSKARALSYDGNGNIIREVWSDRSGREYNVIERSWVQFEDVK